MGSEEIIHLVVGVAKNEALEAWAGVANVLEQLEVEVAAFQGHGVHVEVVGGPLAQDVTGLDPV